jgi:hypothetical protein
LNRRYVVGIAIKDPTVEFDLVSHPVRKRIGRRTIVSGNEEE